MGESLRELKAKKGVSLKMGRVPSIFRHRATSRPGCRGRGRRRGEMDKLPLNSFTAEGEAEARLESREESSWAWKLDAMDQVAGENVVGN